MSRRTRSTSVRRLRAAPALLVLLAALLPAAAMAGEPQPVVISGFAANPSSLPPAGGTVTLSAVISSPAGISHAALSVYQADGGISGIDLALTDPATDTWSGQVAIPGNASNESVSHSLEVFAQANDGGSAQEIVGSIDVAGQPVFDQAPDVFDAALDPVSLPASGGPVIIRASASDDRSVSEVNAVVSGESGATWQVPLDPISSSRFEGIWNAPRNPSPTLSATYSVEVMALDDIGQPGSAQAGTVTVRPVRAGLTVSPTSLAFGAVETGNSRTLPVVVSNNGLAGKAPIRALVVLSGPGFRLTKAHQRRVSVPPGQSRAVRVEFTPPGPGVWTGRLAVSRVDGAQPRLATNLRGRGINAR